MIALSALQGAWRRSLLISPDGSRDTTTTVIWLQAASIYADLRQPSSLPSFGDVRDKSDLDMDQLEALARQEGFAGRLLRHADHFEWTRSIDFQPPQALPDRGRLIETGKILVEEGVDLPYVEHWHRETPADIATAAILLRDAETGCPGAIIRVGERFLFARGRTKPLIGTAPLVEAIRGAPTVAAARDLIDCEISLGRVDAQWTIVRSTLPFRVGATIEPNERGNVLATCGGGRHERPADRIWTIVEREGGSLDPRSA